MSHRSTAIAALMLLALLPAAAGAAGAEPPANWVSWEYAPPGTPPEAGELEVPCGAYGTFVFSSPGWSPAAAEPAVEKGSAGAKGAEAAAVYPSPPLPKTPAASTAKGGKVWIPCERGECLDAAEAAEAAASPWVAVIDWDNLHGWSVGWLVRHLANAGAPPIRTVFFKLYDEALQPFSTLGATDVHVLKKLCEVAEIADDPEASPPLVINMSFGRLRRLDDLTDPATCHETSLSCQVARVLRHLTCPDGHCPLTPTSPRTVPVAAAGNHRLEQFPAALPDVVGAGSLQLEAYRQKKVEPTWETPRDGTDALFPGYGLCLQEGTGAGWPAPAGASYAAAVFSGWLASVLVTQPVEKPLSGGPWFPDWTGAAARLAHGNKRYGSNAAATRLIGQALDPRLETCLALPLSHGEPTALSRQDVGSPLPRLQSFIEVLDELVGYVKCPTPEDRPCVPCIGVDTNRPPLEQQRRRASPGSAAQFLLDRQASAWEESVLGDFPDLLASLVGAERIFLAEVYLRLGEKFFLLPDYQETATPGIELLALKGLATPALDQPSLLYVYRLDRDSAQPLHFWSSVPILLRTLPAQ